MISEERMKAMSFQALQVIGGLWGWALFIVLLAITPSLQADNENKELPEYSAENKTYKLVCKDKVPAACERLIELLKNYDAYEKKLQKEEEERKKHQFDDSGTITFNQI